jgi:hypothetical protein
VRKADRRTFSREALLLALSSIAISVGCGTESGAPPSTPSPAPPPTPAPTPTPVADKTGTIADNHGHEAVITAAELLARDAVSLDIRGGTVHTHTVVLTSADVVSILDGRRVARESTSHNGHSHLVTFN